MADGQLSARLLFEKNIHHKKTDNMYKIKYFVSAAVVFLMSCGASSNMQSSVISPSRTDLKLGVALYSFNRKPLEVALQMADSAGAKYVEGFSFYRLGGSFGNTTMGDLQATDITRIKKMMQEKGIKMTSMYAGDAKNVADWKKYFDVGARFGIKYLVTEPSKNHWDMIDSLAGIYKIKIAIHEHAKGHSAYWHPDSVLAAVNGHKNIGACADLGHWVRSGLDPVECLKKLRGHVMGIHLKDLSEAGNMSANDVTPGTGVIDFKAILKELQVQRFSGYIQVECEHNFDNNRADVQEAIEYITRLTKELH